MLFLRTVPFQIIIPAVVRPKHPTETAEVKVAITLMVLTINGSIGIGIHYFLLLRIIVKLLLAVVLAIKMVVLVDIMIY